MTWAREAWRSAEPLWGLQEWPVSVRSVPGSGVPLAHSCGCAVQRGEAPVEGEGAGPYLGLALDPARAIDPGPAPPAPQTVSERHSPSTPGCTRVAGER